MILSRVRSRFVGVMEMIIMNEFGGVTKFGGQQPRSLIVGALVSRSMDQVQEFAVALLAIYLGVQDF